MLTALFVADFLLPDYVLIGYYSLAPLLAAAVSSVLGTATVATAAFAAALVAATWDAGGFSPNVIVRVGAVVCLGLVAVIVAMLRNQNRRQIDQLADVVRVAERAVLGAPRRLFPDLQVAAVHRSAAASSHMGGDFFEAVHSRLGTTMILGDVRGKGLPAVRLASAVVGGFRYAALGQQELATIARGLDRLVAVMGEDEDFVTALLMHHHDGCLTVLSCGHHDPVVGVPGSFRELALRHEPPLGLGGCRRAQQHPLPDGHLLIAYTDGLVEARDDRGRMLALEQLMGRVSAHDPAQAASQLLDQARRWTANRLEDDVAILAVRRRSVP